MKVKVIGISILLGGVVGVSFCLGVGGLMWVAPESDTPADWHLGGQLLFAALLMQVRVCRS